MPKPKETGIFSRIPYPEAGNLFQRVRTLKCPPPQSGFERAFTGSPGTQVIKPLVWQNPGNQLQSAVETCTGARAVTMGTRHANAGALRRSFSGIWGRSAVRCWTGSIFRLKYPRCLIRNCGREKWRCRRRICARVRRRRMRCSGRAVIRMRGCLRGRSGRIARWMRPVSARWRWRCGG
jgi:hypothetical protein